MKWIYYFCGTLNNEEMRKIFTPNLIFVALVIIVAVISRLLPHLPNITPVAAIALFGGTYINKKSIAFLFPIGILFISDLFLGIYPEIFAVYFSFAITVMIGFLLRKKDNVLNIVLASLSSSLIFFIITNFAVWIGGSYAYPMNFYGLLLCYEAAIPFFRYELFGTLAYNAMFFGTYFLVRHKLSIFSKT